MSNIHAMLGQMHIIGKQELAKTVSQAHAREIAEHDSVNHSKEIEERINSIDEMDEGPYSVDDEQNQKQQYEHEHNTQLEHDNELDEEHAKTVVQYPDFIGKKINITG